MRHLYFLLTVMLFAVLSCTSQPLRTDGTTPSRTTASFNSDPALAMCAQDPVSSLYESLIATTCSVNYAWELIGGPFTDDSMFNCAALYMGGGSVVAAAGGAAQLRLQAWSKNMQGERTTLVRNTALNRKDMGILIENPHPVRVDSRTEIRFGALQRLHENWSNLKMDFAQTIGNSSERIEKILAKYPHNYIRYHYLEEVGRMNGASMGVSLGPNRAAMEASKWALRLGVLSTGVGVVMIAADTLLGSTATACDEHIHAFYEADRDNVCRSTKVASANVMRFLQMESDEQLKTIELYPKLCPIYQEIADTQTQENLKKFGTKEISHHCAEGKTHVELVHDNGLKTEVEISGLKARMRSYNQTLDVEYAKNPNGRVSVAGITWRTAYGGTRPLRYKFPADLEKAGEVRFQNLFQQVAKNTLALEAADLFNVNCQ